MPNPKKNENIIIGILFLLMFFLILMSNTKISYALEGNDSLIIPLHFQTFEFSDKKDRINNISSTDIELPSSTWNITHIELNFTHLAYYQRELKRIKHLALDA